MGLTRLALALKVLAEKGKVTLPEINAPRLYIAPMGEKASVYALKTVKLLRDKGIYAECDIASRSLKAQMKYADKIGACYCMVVGDNELEAGKAELKNMTDKDDRCEIVLDDICAVAEKIAE